MPLTLGITRTQSLAGSTGSGTSPSFNIERALVATSGRPPAAFTTAKAGIDLAYVRASTDTPTRRFAPTSPASGEVKLSSSDRLPVFGGARIGHRQPPVARRHAPPFDPPASLPRHLRQTRVRVDGDRRADHLQHRQGRERVGGGEALGEGDAGALRVLMEQRPARPAPRGRRMQVTCGPAVPHAAAG